MAEALDSESCQVLALRCTGWLGGSDSWLADWLGGADALHWLDGWVVLMHCTALAGWMDGADAWLAGWMVLMHGWHGWLVLMHCTGWLDGADARMAWLDGADAGECETATASSRGHNKGQTQRRWWCWQEALWGTALCPVL